MDSALDSEIVLEGQEWVSKIVISIEIILVKRACELIWFTFT